MVRQPVLPSTRAHLCCFVVVLGIVIVLFFQCMEALLNPPDRENRGMKWGLVAHTTAMFSFVTIYTAMTLNIQSISYIDNREFPGVGEVLPPGPLGYQFSIYSKAISIVPNVSFLLNNWLADGLLVSFASMSTAQASDVVIHSSIVATLFIP